MYAKKLHSLVKRKLGLLEKYDRYSKVNSSDIDSALEEAYIIIVENQIHRPNLNARVREDLKILRQHNREMEFEKNAVSVVVKYPEDYLRLADLGLIVRKPSCGEKEMLVHIVMDEEFREAKRDPNWKCDFNWGTTIGLLNSDGIHVDIEKDLQVIKVLGDYYRKFNFPIYVDPEEEEQYIDDSGKRHTGNQEPELINNFIWRRVADLAVLLLTKDSMDYNKYSIEFQNIVNLDTIYTS